MSRASRRRDDEVQTLPADLDEPLQGQNLPFDPRTPPAYELFRLLGSVGRFGENRREDVIKAQILLANAGQYDMPRPGAPTGWPSGEIDRAIRRYQKGKGLAVDGTMLPAARDGGIGARGEGETLAALQDELGDRLGGYAAPTPDEVDAYHEERAQSAARGEDEPDSGIVTIPEDGVAEHPIGVKRPANDAPPDQETQEKQANPDKLGLTIRLPESLSSPANGVRSDADDPAAPQWRDGQHLAQAVPLPQAIGGAPVPSLQDPHARRDQYGVSEAERQVARMLEQGLKKGMNLLLDGIKPFPHHSRGSTAGQDGGTDYQPADSLPPLQGRPAEPIEIPPHSGGSGEPPEQDPLKGRPNEPAQPNIERLIPPEMKEWYETLEPFDQDLAKELMLVMDRRGDDITQLGNQEFIKRYLKVFAEEFGHIRGRIEHIAGGRSDGVDKEEEYLPNIETKGRLGSSWADITFRFVNHVTETLYGPEDKGERNRINTQTMQKRNNKIAVAKERRSLSNMAKNANGQPVAGFPKLRPDRPDGTVSEEALEAYRQEATVFARKNIQDWIDILRAQGIL